MDHYGMLEEFVTMVTELVPELMSYSQRAQLILGLRARLVLEMCRGEHPADVQTIQPHLDRIKAPFSTAKDHHATIDQVEESEVNFVELVHSLLQDPSERSYFFQEIYPIYFGPKYDAALEMLVWEFISRLEELMPAPDFTQLAALLGDAPSVLEECLQTYFPPDDMKAVLEHHRNLGHFEEKDPGLLPMDDCILSSLLLPPGAKPAPDTVSCTPALTDSAAPGHRRLLRSNADSGGSERSSRRSAEFAKQKLRETRSSGGWQPRTRAASNSQEKNKAQSDTIDLTSFVEAADTDSEASGSNQSSRPGRDGRKRKLSGGVDVPAKQPLDASAFMDSSVDGENSGESPLISIWGEYTDTQESSLPVATDTKVPWSDEETLHLLDIWGKDSVQRALKGCLKNRHIFTQIAQKMAERGYMRTVEQCQTRIKRLKKGYRQNRKGNSKVERKFYAQLERVLGSSAPSSVPEITYDVEEILDEDKPQEDEEDFQFLGPPGQMEIGTRSVPWKDLETLSLIKIWGGDQMQKELRGMHRNGPLFSIISSQLTSQGFPRTPEQCQTRLKKLKSNFRQCYQNNLRGGERVECKFYNELGRILVKDFPEAPQLDEMQEELEDNFALYGQQDNELAVVSQEDRKKVPWSDKETIILLELWGDSQVQQNLRRYPHNGHLFTEISKKLSAHGYSRSAEQCHTRIKRLKASYRQCQETMSSSGTDRPDFKFYDLLEQILDKQPSTSSAAVTDSIEISEDSNSESVTEKDGETSGEKPASGLWTDEETLALIDVWGDEDVQKALRGYVHNGRIYTEMSERLRDHGFSKSTEQCRWKVKSLRINFRQCYDKKKNGRKVDYKFYNELEQILGQEALSLDEYDDRDELVEQEQAAADGLNNPWTEHETAALIEVWAADDVQHSLKTCVRNGHIFAEIAEKMSSLGYLRTAEQCHTRIKRLKKTYRRYCNSQRNGGRSSAYRYFTLLAPVLGDDSIFTDFLDTMAADESLPPLLDEDPVLYEQPSTSHLLADTSRKTPWTELETRTLLTIWGGDYVQLTLKGCLKNRHVFEYISEKMSDQGFIRTSEQCSTRIKRLKHGYFHEKEDFKFFNDMEQIFNKDLKVDSTIADASLSEEMEAFEMEKETSQKQGNQWALADSTKLPWSDGETETLLNVWGSEEIQVNLKSCTKNKHIFLQISQAMTSQGYNRTPEQCQSRVKRLRANFRHFLEGRKGDKQECKFFDLLVRNFGSRYGMTSDPLADDAAEVSES